MPYFSNLQQLLTGLTLTYAGYGLAFQPHKLLIQLVPLCRLVGIGSPSLSTSNEPQPFELLATLALVGVSLLALGYFYLMSIYTQDEKFKRNSVPGRFILAFVSYYITTLESTSSTSSRSLSTCLLQLFASFNLFTGTLMGLSIGFEDGNQVDIDERKKQTTLRMKWVVRERELVEKIKGLEKKLETVKEKTRDVEK
ncbi:hypothetical protein JCM5350_007111 [Sporobolomyces pararoseus]